jgi:hypothetical protein
MCEQTTTPNAELAYRVLDHIDAHPEQWHQGVWIARDKDCGTVGCFAGWTCLLAGDTAAFDHIDPQHATRVTISGNGPQYDRSIDSRAFELLGITPDEAAGLFEASNDRRDLRSLVHIFFGPRPTPVTA